MSATAKRIEYLMKHEAMTHAEAVEASNKPISKAPPQTARPRDRKAINKVRKEHNISKKAAIEKMRSSTST